MVRSDRPRGRGAVRVGTVARRPVKPGAAAARLGSAVKRIQTRRILQAHPFPKTAQAHHQSVGPHVLTQNYAVSSRGRNVAVYRKNRGWGERPAERERTSEGAERDRAYRAGAERQHGGPGMSTRWYASRPARSRARRGRSGGGPPASTRAAAAPPPSTPAP